MSEEQEKHEKATSIENFIIGKAQIKDPKDKSERKEKTVKFKDTTFPNKASSSKSIKSIFEDINKSLNNNTQKSIDNVIKITQDENNTNKPKFFIDNPNLNSTSNQNLNFIISSNKKVDDEPLKPKNPKKQKLKRGRTVIEYYHNPIFQTGPDPMEGSITKRLLRSKTMDFKNLFINDKK